MDCFDSQGYSGLFARKLIESNNGENGRVAGVNFAEAYPAQQRDPRAAAGHRRRVAEDALTRHITYSQLNLRGRYP